MNKILLIFFYIFVNYSLCNASKEFIYSSIDNNSVSSEHFMYLEGLDETANYDILKNSNWNYELKSPNAIYEGFWIKLNIKNKSDIDIIGISHFAQREKKLIIENNNIITDHDYISYDNNYTLFGNDRIHFNYKLNIPKNENTFIYSYFRSKPINRMINLSNLTRIKLGDWDEMFKLRIFRMIRTTFLIAIILFLFFNNTSTYFVTKDKNYLLFSILLFCAFLSTSYFIVMQFGISPNPFIGHTTTCLLTIATILFFANFLDIENNYIIINKIKNLVIYSQVILGIYYFYKSFQFPEGEYFTNIVKYPIEPFGIGYVEAFIKYIPSIILILIFVYISFKYWKSGNKANGFILAALCMPILSIPVIVIGFYLIFTGITIGDISFNLFIAPIAGFFFMLIPIFVSLALAEKNNEFKRIAINKQRELNEQLENKVKERTLELTQANQLITQSINSASIIQNAILPQIDCNTFGFKEFEYVWEPRDIVGGDFYWLDKHNDWTSFVVADCTGHGIPGAFMTLISSTLLDRVKSLDDLSRPDVILNQLDELLESKLRLKENKSMEFGMDIGICSFSRKDNFLRFSGAKMNLYKIIGETVNEFKGDKMSIGYSEKPHPIKFTNHEIYLSDNPNFYIFSDGVTDQVGGSRNLMYGKKRLLKHINQSTRIKTVIQNITDDFNDYQKDNSRRDDLSLFGFSIA